MAWFDIAMLLFISLFAVIGIFNGFFNSLIKLCGTFVTLVLSIFLAKPIANVFQFVFRLKDAMGGVVEAPITPYCMETNENGAISNFFVNKFAKILMGGNYYNEYPQGASDPDFISEFSWKIGELITIAIAALVMFILIKIILSLLTRLVNRLHEYKTIGKMDRVLGGVFGAIKGGLYVSILFISVYLISSAIPSLGQTFLSWMDGSGVAQPIFMWLANYTDGTLLPWLASII